MGRKLKPVPARVPHRRADLHLSLSTEDARFLASYAGFVGETVSAVVARAVRAEARTRGFVVYLTAAEVLSPPAPTPLPELLEGSGRKVG